MYIAAVFGIEVGCSRKAPRHNSGRCGVVLQLGAISHSDETGCTRTRGVAMVARSVNWLMRTLSEMEVLEGASHPNPCFCCCFFPDGGRRSVALTMPQRRRQALREGGREGGWVCCSWVAMCAGRYGIL